MVDPTKGIGPAQGLISGTRVSDSALTRKTDTPQKTTAPKDEINLSPKALSEVQAQDVASSVRSLVEREESLTLGSGSGFDESL